jgi:thiol-disulfide isomerase/thioredoxin
LKLPLPRAFDGKNIPVQRLNPYFRLYYRRDSENEPLKTPENEHQNQPSMKQFSALMAAAMISVGAYAQLPDGSTAPDWTATDINGVEHNLQSYLDQGMTVIIHFSATWCGPCWAYHNTHILRDLYDTFGPNGTGDLMVFYLEGDDSTTLENLHGTGTPTEGDWVTGTTYPIIDNASNIFDDYAGAYYPTIYTICPDGILVESSQVSLDQHVAIAFQDCENTITGPAPLMSYNGATMSCGGAAWMASTEMSNLGPDNVTAATFEVTLNGNTNIVNWTGDLASGGTVTVDLGEHSEVGDLNVSLMEVNAETWSASEDVTVIGTVESTTYVQVRITTDNWPGETGWVINDDMGNTIASVAVGSLTQADTEFTWDVGLGDLGCYKFTMFDSYGDGLYASQYGAFADGTAGVYSMDGEMEMGVVWEYDGDSGIEFAEVTAGMEATSVAGIEEGALSSTVNIFPNPTSNNTQVEFTTKQAGMATLEVFNLIGERVVFQTLGNLPVGTNRAVVDMAGLNAGIYLVNLNAGGETTTMRVTKQ